MRPIVRAALTATLAALPFALYDAAGAERSPAAGAAAAARQDSLAIRRERAAAAVLERIRGRENEPAETVFENVEVMRGIPAGQFVRIMDRGFGGSLGVTCGHCHVRGNWASDDKPEKQVAREMWTMTRTINQDLLARIDNLKSENPTVNCGTCHRGQVSPPPNNRPQPGQQPQAPPPQQPAPQPPSGR
jgi:Photosynthetic reaction centre cytochrome C subunit